MQPKVTVVVPIWGVEKYIERCARSLFEQTLDNIEYIFVNDCTPDKSMDVLKTVIEEYPDRKKSVKIIHQSTNQGLPRTRQKGIENATGEYIFHCDSDDWVEVCAFSDLYSFAKKHDVDIVAFDDLEFYSEEEQHVYRMFPHMEATIINNNIQDWLFRWSLCCKLIRHSVYNNSYTTPLYNNGEDMALFLQLIRYANKIYYIPHPYYIANKQNESISRVKELSAEYKQYQNLRDNVILLEKSLGQELSKDDVNGLIRLKLATLESLRHIIKKDKTAKYYIGTSFDNINWKILFRKEISIREKARYIRLLLS